MRLLIVLTLLVAGCNAPQASTMSAASSDFVIRVGDSASDAKAKITTWGLREAPLAWAYGVVEWQGTSEKTLELSRSNTEQLRRENDFNDSPSYHIGKGPRAVIVFFKAKNGVVTDITRIAGSTRDEAWESGFKSVTLDGEFSR